jgi:dephospho-CoA kinase
MVEALIGITGMPGSGKSAIKEIAKKFNIPVVSMGDVVREETRKRGLELTPENVGNMAIKLREMYGKEAIAVPCLNYIEERFANYDFVIIEGVRSLYEVNYFKKHYPFLTIAIHASPKTRFERLKKRQRKDDTAEWEEFVKRDMRELGFSIGGVIALADYMIVNEGDYESYLQELEDTLKKIIELFKK